MARFDIQLNESLRQFIAAHSTFSSLPRLQEMAALISHLKAVTVSTS
jgi:hypothetical protein